jgi:magnesium-transporting ATPase (P-type)
MPGVLVAHAAATWAMTGLIWFVQIVHYPLFSGVGRPEFAAYEAAHARLTTWVVAPLMLTELITALGVALSGPQQIPSRERWFGLALVGALWLSTAAVQVPLHNRLAAGFDAGAWAALVQSNWIRTAVWSMRALLAARWLLL